MKGPADVQKQDLARSQFPPDSARQGWNSVDHKQIMSIAENACPCNVDHNVTRLQHSRLAAPTIHVVDQRLRAIQLSDLQWHNPQNKHMRRSVASMSLTPSVGM